MTPPTCHHCGAAARGLVCDYCGTLHHYPRNIPEEKEAWIQFLGIMQTQPKETQIRMLQSGFLPDSIPTLIDAGLHCISLLDNSQVADSLVSAAHHRLQATVTKLKILPSTPESERAITEFSQAIDQYRHADRQLTRVLVIGIVFLLALCGGLALLWLAR